MTRLFLSIVVLTVAFAGIAHARVWTDASGHYKIDADMVGFNESSVVLKKKETGDLVAVAIEALSEADREYLKSEEASRVIGKSNDAMQTWTMRSGLKVIGKVVDYGRRDVTIRRFRGDVYVNDKKFDSLDGVYRKMVPRIVGHFEMMEFEGKKEIENFLKKQSGGTKTYTCEGLMLQLENGDMYAVPFFFFSDEDLEVLRPGWERWRAAEEDHEKEYQRFVLESQAKAREESRDQSLRQMMQLQIQLQGYEAGLFDLWEVTLLPPSAAQMPMQLVVPGRSSAQAANTALQKYPGYRVGPIAKVRRRY